MIVIAPATPPAIPAGSASQATPARSAPPVLIAAPPATVEDEVLANIRQQHIGPATLESFNLPDQFLRRVADRVIRTTYLDQFQVVLDDTHGAQPGEPGAAPSNPVTGAPGPGSAPGTPGPARGSTRWAWIVGAAIALGAVVGALRAVLRRGAPG